MKLTSKFLSLILSLAILTGCTSVPTPASTVPATATAPTLVPTKIPTITPTPMVLLDVPAGPYPGSLTDRLITETDLAKQLSDFEALQQDNMIRLKTERVVSRLKTIGGPTVTTQTIVDGTRWGVIPRVDGRPGILQKTTDGRNTWVNVVDASAIPELVTDQFDAKQYRLIPLTWSVGLSEDATSEVITQVDWMVHVWRDADTGKILAWYDAVNNQYLTVEGKNLETFAMETPPADAAYPSSIEDRIVFPEQIQVMKDEFLKMADDLVFQPKVDLIQKNLLAIAEKDGIESPTVTGYVDGNRWGMVISDAKGKTYRLRSTPPPVWTTLAGREAYQILNNCSLNISPYRFNPLETPVEIPEDNLVVRKESGGYYITSLFDPTSQDVLIMEDTGYIYDHKIDDKTCQPWFIVNLREISKDGPFNYDAYPQGYIVQDGQWIIIFQGVSRTNGSHDQQYVLQMRNEPAWSNIKDAGAYAELTSESFDPENFRLIPIAFPGIPEDAEFTLVNQNGWMVSAFIEPSGKMAAWYDAAQDQYLGDDGNKMEIAQKYKPFSEMKSWEDCVAPEQQLPWINDPWFDIAWDAFLRATTPTIPPEQYDYGGLNIGTVMMLSNDPNFFKIIYKYNWDTSSLTIPILKIFDKKEGGETLACSTMVGIDGSTIQLIRFPIRVVPDVKVSEFGTAYVYITLAVDELLLQHDYLVSPGVVNEPAFQPIQIQFSKAQAWKDIRFVIFSKTSNPIGQEELTDPYAKNISYLIQKNQQNGVQEALFRMLTYQITKDDIDLLNRSIIPASKYIFTSIDGK